MKIEVTLELVNETKGAYRYDDPRGFGSGRAIPSLYIRKEGMGGAQAPGKVRVTVEAVST